MSNPQRVSMADLISKVRLLINDPAGAVSQQFTDQQIQDELDRNRDDINYQEMTVRQTIAPGGTVSWLDYYAPVEDWEADALIYGYIAPNSWSDIKAGGLVSTVDYLVGHWVLNTSTRPPIYIVGKTYDVYMAASGLLAQWASREMLNFDASQMGTHASRSQKYKMLSEQSTQMAARRRPRMIEMVRRDVNPMFGQATPQGQPTR